MKKGTLTLFISATLVLAPAYLAHAQKQATIPGLVFYTSVRLIPIPTSMYLFKG